MQKGDRVCILSPNSHFFLESYYGVTQIGAMLVPLNYRLTAADHEYIINHAGVSVVLVDHEYAPMIDQIRAELPTVRHWIVAQDEGDGAGRVDGLGDADRGASPTTRDAVRRAGRERRRRRSTTRRARRRGRRA